MGVRAQSKTPNQFPAMVARGVDMTGTGDNAFVWQMPVPTRYILTQAIARLVSGAFSVACLGGVYTAASKGGNALVAATQTYAGLTGAGKIQNMTLAAIDLTDVTTSSQLYFALSTGNGAALTADIYVWIDVLDA